jgi:hypothetical protein
MRFKFVPPMVILSVLAVVGISSAGAQSDPVIIIPVDTDVRAPEGSLTTLVTIDISADLVGATCEVRAEAANNSSVHPGNDVIIESGGSSVVLLDVEGSAGQTTEASGVLVLGPTGTVTLRMGPDERFSAGLFVIECSGGPITTTTTTTTTTSAPTILPPTLEPPATTTTVPTLVLPEVEVAPDPVPVTATPNFTG